MRPISCGIDFGTSNSTVGIARDAGYHLVPLEGESLNIPSALFFDFDDGDIIFGRKALQHYSHGHHGRLMRAMKTVLGSTLINEKTRVGKKQITFIEIVGKFLSHLKKSTEEYCQQPVTSVVLGRPVFFVDGDEKADHAAQSALEGAARAQGFKHIEFQYEPVAAALDYERICGHEEIAVVIDIGGGTADFAVVRVSPQSKSNASRLKDVLASNGVHVGGNDFDRALSLTSVMPHFGYGSYTRNQFDKFETAVVPNHHFVDLASWHRINFQYSAQNIAQAKSLLHNATEPKKLANLVQVLEQQRGHEVASQVEAAKIDLATIGDVAIELPVGTPRQTAITSQKVLNSAIANSVEKLKIAFLETLHQANIKPNQVQTVFLTGGSTLLPIVRNSLTALIPSAKIVDGDKFGSVGIGLAIDAHNKFGQ